MIRFARAAVIVGSLWGCAETAGAQQPPVRIILDTSPQAVEYQLRRLSNDELMRVERQDSDRRYRPVYMALLTRKGIGREYFEEALTALTATDKASKSTVLLEGLSKIQLDDEETAERMLRVLFAQPADALRKERERFAKAIADASSPLVVRGGYGALMLADGNPQSAWSEATKRDGHLAQLLRSVPHLGDAQGLRKTLVEPVAALLSGEGRDPAVRAAAIPALAWARPDAATFRTIAREVLESSDADVRAAGIRALQRVPRDAWPVNELEPLVRSLTASLVKLTPEARTEAANLEAVQLAGKLADALPEESRRSVRRELRGLGVQVVRIEAIPEQMLFDVKWFAVEAGKPVQIVLYNPDAMSHNLLVTKPGALREVGMAATTMTLPTDPRVKPYVPDTPLVLHATRLLNWGESERLSFPAPKEPGEYPFVCTFPGHWVRMYGVMLVVPDMDAWELKRTVPNDPMTNQPFPSQRN